MVDARRAWRASLFTPMTLSTTSCLGLAAVIALLPGAGPMAYSAAEAQAADAIVPLIVIADVPLTDAIRNLARQSNLNHILDPRVPGSSIGPGRQLKQPSVSGRWERRSARGALLDLLKEHKLTMVMNPATSVARIAPENAGVSPISTNVIGIDTGAALPLVVLEGMSLVDAIKNIAKRANLEASFDPRFTASKVARDDGVVSIRWQNITTRQAFAALLDNFDLMMTEDLAKRSVWIALKPEANRSSGKER